MEKTCDNCQLFTDFGCCIKFGYHADRCDPERDWVNKLGKEIVWHNIEKDGNPPQSGRYKVRANNGWIGGLSFDTNGNYWSTMGYQSDIKDWAEL